MESVWDTIYNANSIAEIETSSVWSEEDDLPEGVSVGDTKTAAQDAVIRKGVKEQQMYIMAIKALQEAMTRIETLESSNTALAARIKALEDA